MADQTLMAQATAIKEVCKAAIESLKASPGAADYETAEAARAILQEARARVQDKVLAALKLDDPCSWFAVLTAMELVGRTLHEAEVRAASMRSSGGGGSSPWT